MKLLLRRRWAYHGTFLRHNHRRFIAKILFWWGFILGIIFLLSWNSVVKADNFYPSGDILYCEMYLGVGLTYQGLPSQGTNIGFKYNPLLVKGQTSNYWTSHNFLHIGIILRPNPRRYQTRVGAVTVPPRTMVETGLMTYNLTGHIVSLPTSKLFISQPRPADGDLSRILKISNVKTGYGSFKYLGKTRQRRGKYVILSNLGSFTSNSWGKPPAGKKIASWETIQPIVITNKWVQKGYSANGQLVVNLKLELKNQSTYNLSGIAVSAELAGQKAKKTLTIPANSSAVAILEWRFTKYPLKLNITKIEVADPNQHKECVTTGSSNGVTTNGNTRTFIAKRTDSGTSAGWSRYQPGFAPVPAGNFFCVTLLPYTLLEASQSIELFPQVNLLKKSNISQIKPGQNVNYEIEVNNIGPTLNKVIVRDYLLADFLSVGQVKNISAGGRLVTTANPPYIEWNLIDFSHGKKTVLSFDFTLNDDVRFLPNQLKNEAKVIYQNKILDQDSKNVTINKKVDWNLAVQSQTISCSSTVDQYSQKLQITINNQEKYDLRKVILQIKDLATSSCVIKGSLQNAGGIYNWQKGLLTNPFTVTALGKVDNKLDLLVTAGCSGQTMTVQLQMGKDYSLKRDIILPKLDPQMCVSNTVLISNNNQVKSDVLGQKLDNIISQNSIKKISPLINKVINFKRPVGNQSPRENVLRNDTNSTFRQKAAKQIGQVLRLEYTGVKESISKIIFVIMIIGFIYIAVVYYKGKTFFK